MSNYADTQVLQVHDLPVFRFDNTAGSLYSAFQRHFEDIWDRSTISQSTSSEIRDYPTSAGGIVYVDINHTQYILLLKRKDNYWVLPKGHKEQTDTSAKDATIREIQEETGISSDHLEIEREISTYTDTTFADEPKVVIIYAVRYKQSNLPKITTDKDHVEGKWWPTDESLPTLRYSYQAQAIDTYFALKAESLKGRT